MANQRSNWLLCVGCTLLLLIGYFYSSEPFLNTVQFVTVQKEKHEPNYQEFVVDTTACRIRSYDPFDAHTITTYFGVKPTVCKNEPPPLLESVLYPEEGKSGVRMRKDVLSKYYNVSKSRVICTYQVPVRDVNKTIIDRYYNFLPTKNVSFDMPMEEEYLWVKCYKLANSTKKPPKFFYEQPVMLAKVKNASRPLDAYLERPPLHVLVLGMDSVSRLNCHRQYKETLEFLKSKPKLVELYGYNKIGLNSGPNQIPLLTGQFRRPTDQYFDNVTEYLWDIYEQRGFRTLFFEEQWSYGLFVYPSLQGFKEVPTTYWPRPMMQAVDKSKLKNNGWCIGPRYPGEMYLDYVHDLMAMLKASNPLFSYAWFSEVAHDTLNGAKRMDKPFKDFLRRLDVEGILNNTALFFMSDHGFRFGSFRNTAQGKFEDDLPFGFVLMPEWYYQLRPNAYTNLKINSRRLVTAYDIHTTLLELSDVWNDARPIATTNGTSLFSTLIPEDRTCKAAKIDLSYCECNVDEPIPFTSPIAEKMSTFLVNKLNAILEQNNATDKCHNWIMTNITDAKQVYEGHSPTKYYKIAIAANPGASLFEAMFEYDSVKNSSLSLVKTIDRTDWFSSHAKCVKASTFERYCYCKK